MRVAALLLVWLACAGAAPVRLITDISQARIDIVYTFRGAELLVFGAIQYPPGKSPDEQPGLAIVVRGPAEPLTIRRKARVAGIWLNTASARFESVPGFYAVATSAPIAQLVDERTAAIWEIGIGSLQLSPTGSLSQAESAAFERGLIDLRVRQGLFAEHEGAVTFTQNILYRARIAIPAAVPVGDYTAQIFLIRKGDVIAQSALPIAIEKSGFERWVYVAAHNHGVWYGLVAVLAAVLAGLGAAAVVRRN